MDDVLRKALASLDGPADRIANLTHLIASLSPLEARRVKDLVSSSLQYRDFAKLPLEILALVAQDLEADDLEACLAASRTWRDRFSSHPVLFGFCKHRFPDLINGRKSSPSHSSFDKHVLAAVRSVAKWYRDPPLGKGIVGKLVLGPSEAFPLDRTFHGYEESEKEIYDLIPGSLYDYTRRNARFHDGKVAWCAHRHGGPLVMVLDDYRLSRRKISTHHSLSAEFESIQSVDDKFVVAAAGRYVCAWNYLEPGKKYQASMPSHIRLCETVGDTVVMIGADIWFWRPGRGDPFTFYDVPQQAPGLLKYKPAGAILHPDEGSERLFLVFGYDEWNSIISVYEIQRGQLPVERRLNTREVIGTHKHHPWIQVHVSESNSFGLYQLAQIQPFDSGCSISIEFDVESRKFIITRHQVPKQLWSWNSGLLPNMTIYNGALIVVGSNDIWTMIRNNADLRLWDSGSSEQCPSSLKPKLIKTEFKSVRKDDDERFQPEWGDLDLLEARRDTQIIAGSLTASKDFIFDQGRVIKHGGGNHLVLGYISSSTRGRAVNDII